jgi:hypothetical protein
MSLRPNAHALSFLLDLLFLIYLEETLLFHTHSRPIQPKHALLGYQPTTST